MIWVARACGAASGSVTAITIPKAAPSAPDENHLWPSITQSSPSRTARVRSVVGSEPGTSGSVIEKNDRSSPATSGQEPALLLLLGPVEQEDLGIPGVGRLAAEDELTPHRAADVLVEVRIVEEACSGAACLGRHVRRPEPGGAHLVLQSAQQLFPGFVLALDRSLVREHALGHEGADALEAVGGGSPGSDRHAVSITHRMRLGFYMGYAPPGTSPLELIELACTAEALGYDSAWAAEAWGTDAITPLAWLGALTERIKLGTAIMQIPGRSPANAAMTAATLDLLSGGRFLMGIGTSGPQVVEGWHGQEWGKPLGKTREYVEIVRAVLRRERLEHHGEHYDIPVRGGTGLGKPLKLMARPLRSEIPIYLASIGPKAVELAFEIADGWLPIFWSPEKARSVFPLDRAREGFEIAPSVPAVLTDDVTSGRDVLKEYYSFYIGGMGARARTSTTTSSRATATRRSARDPGSVPGRKAARGGGEGAGRVRRRGRARRPGRADARPAGRVARVGRDDDAHLDARRGDAAGGGGRRGYGVRHPESASSALSASRGRLLEDRGAGVLGAQLATDVAAVDRLAEDGRLPERERLEPGERLDVAAARFTYCSTSSAREGKPGSAVTGDEPSALALPPGSL